MKRNDIGLILSLSWLLGMGMASTPVPNPSIPQAQNPEEHLEAKTLLWELRHMGPTLERVNPRSILRKLQPYEGTGYRVELPYVVVSRKDRQIIAMVDPDCPEYLPSSALELLEKPQFASIRPWVGNPSPEAKKKAVEQWGERLRDGQCTDGTWRLPYSSTLATQEAAGKLKRAWERFEDRYFWRTVTDLNNPTYWLPFCLLGLGFNSFTQGGRPPKDFIPQEGLPPEVGNSFSQEILDLVSTFKKNYAGNLGLSGLTGFSGEREAEENYLPESYGQFRKPLYLPFIPSIAPSQFCDNLPIKFPIFHIPATEVRACGVPVWSSPDYPDRPWVFDQGEADRRIQDAMAHAYARYYPDYLLDALVALLPFSNVLDKFSGGGQGGASVEGNIDSILNSLKGIPSHPQAQSDLGSAIADVLNNIEGIMYFPVPWQAPIAGGGAVITPVYDYLYPDPLRVSVDLMTIYDMVGALLKGEALTPLEKVALALYYLQPLMEFMDQPILPGVVEMRYRETPVGGAVNALYGIVRGVAMGTLTAFQSGLRTAAEKAFGPEAGAAFALGATVILAPLKEIFDSPDPDYFVAESLKLLVKLDGFLISFTGGKEGFRLQNRINGVLVSPGLWRFETLKRVFPPSAPITQRLFGYASFFASWSEFQATIIPDPTAYWAPGEYALAAISRLVGFWHLPIKIDVCINGVTVFPDIPRYMPLAPYFLPFMGERIQWGWMSIPEGYPIPLVKGLPGGVLPALGSDHALSGYFGGYPGLVKLYEEKILGLQGPGR